MFLKSLESVGFKSFVEAKIEFPRGITAVVGPNGSGKSNVVDAILWVLGEQSTKTLRSERMEDVIFNGTQVRKPMGMAEVSLVIGGLQPGDLQGIGDLADALRDYSEIMITRRLFRNGDSEYLINKTLCRLKDVRGVMLETRAGTKGHTVIAQGQLDQILNASPQARRELIEETAGIVRYKKQKAEALRKLEATQQNLVRLRDVIGEVKKQLNWLERQAQQARTYDSLQREARTLEVQLLTDDHRRLTEQARAIQDEVSDLDRTDAGLAAEEARAQAEQQEIKFHMQQEQERLHSLRQELTAVETQRAQALAQIDVERNKGQLYEQQKVQALDDSALYKEEHDRAQQEMDGLHGRVAELDAELQAKTAISEGLEQNLRERVAQKDALVEHAQAARQQLLQAAARQSEQAAALARLETRAQETAGRAERLAADRVDLGLKEERLRQQVAALLRDRSEVEAHLQTLRADCERAGQELEQVGVNLSAVDQRRARDLEQLAGTESRLRTLQSVVREEMGYGREGEEDGTSLRSCDGVGQAIAEWLVVPDGYERAVEAVLGERVRAWFVEDPRHAREAVAFLKQRELGRGAFVPRGSRWGGRGAEEQEKWWPALAEQPGVLGRAMDLVRGQDEVEGVLAALFLRVVFVQDLDAVVRLWEQKVWTDAQGPTLVTLAGEVLDASGILTGGLASASAGVLQRRREVRHLEVRREELLAAIEAARMTREALIQQGDTWKGRRRELETQLREAEMKVLSLSKDHGGSEHSLHEVAARAERLLREEQALEEERRQLSEQILSCRESGASAAAARDEHEGRLQDLHRQQQEMEQALTALREESTAARLAVGTLRGAREHAVTTLGRLKEQIEDCTCRLGHLAETLAGLTESIQKSLELREQYEASCQQLGHQVESLQVGLESAEEGLARHVAAAQALDETLADIRRRVSRNRERRLDVEVRRAQVATQLETVAQTLSGTYDVTMSPGVESDTPAVEADVVPGELLSEADVTTMRERLQKIRDRLARIGGVNLAAIEEHRELEERHRFLSSQEQDLTTSIKSLRDIIQRINRTTKELFHETFAQLQEKFAQVFQKVFPGGRAELVMVEPAPDAEGEGEAATEPGVDIVAQPPGKRLKNITMLSGGEKTLTAMALLIASFLIRPTPFCILDEIDAPLDEENIGRFTAVLRELAATAQFIVITHNKRTMAIADSLFGVTMEEPGVSKIVSVRVADLQPA